MSEELNRRWTDHDRRIVDLEIKTSTHDDLIKQLMLTQTSICTSLKEMTGDIKGMTGDIKGMRGDVEIVASGRVAADVIRKSVLWIASVIGGLGVIAGAGVTTYAYFVHGVDLISNLIK